MGEKRDSEQASRRLATELADATDEWEHVDAHWWRCSGQCSGESTNSRSDRPAEYHWWHRPLTRANGLCSHGLVVSLLRPFGIPRRAGYRDTVWHHWPQYHPWSGLLQSGCQHLSQLRHQREGEVSIPDGDVWCDEHAAFQQSGH